jgi:cobalt-zinc-cadmium efflux system membrane fusion protein
MKKIKTAHHAALLFLLFAGLSGCGKTEKKNDRVLADSAFCIPRQLMSVIELDTVSLEQVKGERLLTGKVTFDEEKVIKIFPLAGGIVQQVNVQLGDYVEKGKVLAIISSSDIANMEKELSTSESNLSIAEKNLDASREMYNSGLITEREYNTAQKEFKKANSEVERINEVLRIYSGSGKSDYIVRAPISGFIVEKKVNTSMQIRADNTDNLFTISDLKDIWIMANVYESDISKIKEGYHAEVTTISYPDRIFDGKVDKIFNVLDPVNKVMKIRIQLDNEGYLLKPEMFASVRISYLEDLHLMTIPSKSVIFEHSKNYIIKYKDTCNVSVREIEIYKTLNENTYILGSGLERGDRIISRSQLLIYNALTQ